MRDLARPCAALRGLARPCVISRDLSHAAQTATIGKNTSHTRTHSRTHGRSVRTRPSVATTTRGRTDVMTADGRSLPANEKIPSNISPYYTILRDKSNTLCWQEITCNGTNEKIHERLIRWNGNAREKIHASRRVGRDGTRVFARPPPGGATHRCAAFPLSSRLPHRNVGTESTAR